MSKAGAFVTSEPNVSPPKALPQPQNLLLGRSQLSADRIGRICDGLSPETKVALLPTVLSVRELLTQLGHDRVAVPNDSTHRFTGFLDRLATSIDYCEEALGATEMEHRAHLLSDFVLAESEILEEISSYAELPRRALGLEEWERAAGAYVIRSSLTEFRVVAAKVQETVTTHRGDSEKRAAAFR